MFSRIGTTFSQISEFIRLAWKTKWRGGYFILIYILFPLMIVLGLGGIVYNLTPLFEAKMPGAIIGLLCALPPIILLTIYYSIRRASRILINWFGVEETDHAYELIISHIFSEGYPKIHGSKGELDLKDKDETERLVITTKINAGLPTKLTLDADTAVYTELSGRPHVNSVRTEPEQILLPHEKIRATFDLRDRIAFSSGPVEAITRDGIQVEFNINVGYHIRRAGESSLIAPYPVDPEALYQLVYNRSVSQSGGEPAPLEVLIPGLVSGPMRNEVAKYAFSEIIERSFEKKDKSLTELGSDVAEISRLIANGMGITIKFVNLILDNYPEDIRKQIVENQRRVRSQTLSQTFGREQADTLKKQLIAVLDTLKAEGFEGDLSNAAQLMDDLVFIRQTLRSLLDEEGEAMPLRRAWRRPMNLLGGGGMSEEEAKAIGIPTDDELDNELGNFPQLD